MPVHEIILEMNGKEECCLAHGQPLLRLGSLLLLWEQNTLREPDKRNNVI